MKKILTYLILVILFSSLGYYLVINSRSLGISPFAAMFYLMWCPALSGIITSLVYEKSLKGLGFRFGKLKWLGLAYLLPLVYGGLAYGFIWIFGFGGINPAYQFNFFHLVIYGTLFNIAFAAGEEIGWRGFLVPHLYNKVNFTATCLITGVIWSVWHFPLIISGVYLATMPMIPQLILLVVTVTAITFVFSWFRIKSGSVWAAIILHASHNLYLQRFFDPLTTQTGSLSKYMTGESGLVLTVIFISMAIIFWSLRKKLPPKLIT